MKLSIVIPAHNEEKNIRDTIESINKELLKNNIEHEIFVTNDHSTDNTAAILQELRKNIDCLRYETNQNPNGFGYAVRFGLEHFTGDCVAIMMADSSDSPQDLVRFYNKMKEGNYDCVFGSRFIPGGKTNNYPTIKLIVNRIANTLVRLTFRLKYNDCTNAFKLYKKETINGLRPFLSPHFNLTLELPLKAIVRGYSYTVLPNSWSNRKTGTSKLKLKEMGSRYFFILLYCFIEKYFSKGDYRKFRSQH